MKFSTFKEALQQAPTHQLRFTLPDGDTIPAHAHITEVGRVDKTFIDCGGTVRKASTCLLQVWVAHDTEHRLEPGTLASILERAVPVLSSEDVDVEIEYEDGRISQFPVEMAGLVNNELQFQLGSKHTDCLAQDVCLPDSAGKCGC